jgi:FAD/FMN-containing dehydrogenase
VCHARRSDRRLQPVSSTGGHYRGDTLCAAETAIVDLSGFDEIVRCDRRNRALMFEAGVAFDALANAARAAGLRPMLPLCPRPGKSALAAYLDREPTIYPRFQWDIADPLLCTEIVLGSGELFRTGSAAGPGSLVEQWLAGDAQKNPMGPGPADFMRIFQGAQGAFGIVTWCSTKAEPVPCEETLYVVGSDTLEPLIEMTYGLLRRNHPDVCFLVDGPALAALEQRDRATFERTRASRQPWNLVFSLSKPRFAGDEKLAYVRREVCELGRSLGLGDDLDGFASGREALLRILTDPAHPTNTRWWKLAGRAATQELFLQATMDRVPDLLAVAAAVLRDHGFGDHDLLRYVQPQLGGRCCHLELVLPTDAPAELSALLVQLTRELRAAGGYFSRPHGPGRDAAVEGQSALPLLRKLGRIFDPDAVFLPNAPGFLSEPEASEPKASEPEASDGFAPHSASITRGRSS